MLIHTNVLISNPVSDTMNVLVDFSSIVSIQNSLTAFVIVQGNWQQPIGWY